MADTLLQHNGKLLIKSDGTLMRGDNCCRRVLVWTANSQFSPSMLTLTGIYQAMGLCVDTEGTWSGNLGSYKLIIWPIASSDPSWWAQIAAGTWQGRIHITAEHNASFLTSVTYVDSLSGVTGIGVTGDSLDSGCGQAGTAETDALTAGQSTIEYAATSQVSGGTTLSKTVTGAHPWLARNKVGTIDFVVAGDSNHLSNDCGPTQVNDNASFIQNLWNVAV